MNLSSLMGVARQAAGHRRFPLALALAAVVLMLPALQTGLLLDDLTQRSMQFRPAELPARLLDTGFVSRDSGKLGSVLCNLFGLPRGEEPAARARAYGLIPWWAPKGLQAALWRPLTAFTHWLDYRISPNTPALMHAHNIAWFALAVFLAARIYREIEAFSPGSAPDDSTLPFKARQETRPGIWIAAAAAVLFLLDPKTYFPVMFVANRGFIMSLVFGLLCLSAHLRWRTTGSRTYGWLSALCLLLSLLANEGGASTLAFLAAYALVLEPGRWRRRLGSLLPAAVVILGWRLVYSGSGFGVRMIGGYIDPGYEPLLFLRELPWRANALLGGQLTGLPPEVTVLFNSKWQTVWAIFFACFNMFCAVVFFPLLRRDRVARFWLVAMLLALVPAATVFPLSKNMAFVAVGAFGVIAAFLVHFAVRQARVVVWGPLRGLAWGAAVWLVAAHVPGALGGRMLMAMANPIIPKVMARWCAFDQLPEIGERDVVVVNNPSMLSTMAAPFYRAYHGLPVPRTMRILMPGGIPFEISRTDAATLVLKAKDADLFDFPATGAIHGCNLFKTAAQFLAGGRRFRQGERVTQKGLDIEVLEVSPRGMPSVVAFHFEKPLEPEEIVWLFFDWRTRRYSPLRPPRIGETIEIAGIGP